MFHRAYNNSSNAQKEKSSINKIWTSLLENGYAPKILERLLREVQRSRAKMGRGDTGQRGRGDAGQRGRVDKGQRRKDDKDRLDSADGFLTLPYIDEELLRKVKHIVGKSKFRVRIAWRNNNKLKTALVRSSICKPSCPGGRKCHLCMSEFQGDCTQKNIVYQIRCTLCQKKGMEVAYVGESMRPVRLRYNEHRRDAINKTTNTPFGDHFLHEHMQEELLANSNILNLKILYRAQDHPDRKIAESILIRNLTPTLNTQGSSWPIMREG